MRASTATLGSAAFFVVAPATFVGGVVLISAGLVPPVHAFVQFVKAGGTPMPLAPAVRPVISATSRRGFHG